MTRTSGGAAAGRVTLAAGLLLAAGGCRKESTAPTQPAAPRYDEYGSGVVDGATVVPIPAIAREPAKWDGQTVTVKGIVVSVCPASGCFLFLGEGSDQLEVDLKEKGFTIPPGDRWAGHVCLATGVVRASAGGVKRAGHGLRMLEKTR